MASCPWQVFLKRLLRIEPMPDPLEALPGVDALLLGNLVHSVLERLVRQAMPGMPATLKDAVAGPGVSVPWPDEKALARILVSEAARAVREAGMSLEGLARVLEMQARPYILAARALDWTHIPTDPQVLAAEVKGVLSVEGQDGLPRLIHFLADRVDRIVAGLRFTDYKTGKPISNAVKEATRQSHFLKAVSKGERLQAVAYILGAEEEPAEGRYVFLKPDIPETRRVFSVGGEKEEFVQGFREATRALLAALEQGAFFPRLVEPDGRKEPRQCEYCEVSQACVRGDTGARMRILSWTQRAKEAVTKAQTLAPHEEALLRVWALRDQGFERAEATGEAEEQ
jgi:RecB family exonuclease